MDFFEHQERSRRTTAKLLRRFVVGYAILLAGLLLSLGVVWFVVWQESDLNHQDPYSLQRKYLTVAEFVRHPAVWRVYLVVSVLFAIAIFLSALSKVRSLSKSGGAVALALGARPVEVTRDDIYLKRLLNIVEEMAIASGLPIPQVFVMQDQESINAFASGPSPEKSAIAVTRGALTRLTRDELQAVVAHEFGHIFHGDVRLNIRLAAYVYAMLVLSTIGKIVARFGAELNRTGSRVRSSRKGDGAALPLILMVVGGIIWFFGLGGYIVSLFLKSAIGREREYAADATAVQLTRNPLALANALKKVGGFGASISKAEISQFSHFCIAEPQSEVSFLNFSTHPPLPERIARLDPSFTGTFAPAESIHPISPDAVVAELSGGSAPVVVVPQQLQESSHDAAHAGLLSMYLFMVHPEGVDPAVLQAQERLLQERGYGVLPKEQQVSLAALLPDQWLLTMQLALGTMHRAGLVTPEYLQTVHDLVLIDRRLGAREILAYLLLHFSGHAEYLSLFPSQQVESLRQLSSSVQPMLSVVLHAAGVMARELQRDLEQALGFQISEKPALLDELVWAIGTLRGTHPACRHQLMDILHGALLRVGAVPELVELLVKGYGVLLRIPQTGIKNDSQA